MNVGFCWFKVGSGYGLKRRLGSPLGGVAYKKEAPLIVVVVRGFSFRSNELGELVFRPICGQNYHYPLKFPRAAPGGDATSAFVLHARRKTKSHKNCLGSHSNYKQQDKLLSTQEKKYVCKLLFLFNT